MKIYTKTGDSGRTGLYAGGSCSKDDLRIETIGTVDELNSAIGVVLAHLDDAQRRAPLEQVQAWLFEAGAELASPDPLTAGTAVLGDSEVEQLEAWIDVVDEALPALKTFILPGGSPAGAQLHAARTLCRRVERRIVGLRERETQCVRLELIRFFNRLSDWLFVLARDQNRHDGKSETPWLPRRRSARP